MLILFHGTSAKNAERIEEEGFSTEKISNWKIKSKPGFVYLSSAYAPFYAMKTHEKMLALIKCKVDIRDCYPEDDFLMYALGKPTYTQEDLDKVVFEAYKTLAKQSLQFMGNVAVKPRDIKIIGIRIFSGENLLYKCDPVISPINFRIMGDYYKQMSEHLFNTGDVESCPSFM